MIAPEYGLYTVRRRSVPVGLFVATLGANTLHFGYFADKINLKTHRTVSLIMPTNTRRSI